jgi:hypothetical protein
MVTENSRRLAFTLLALAACSEPASSLGPPPSIPIAAASFHDHFELVATLTPEQSEANPIVYLSGGLITPQHVGIVDVSQGNAKLFSRDGALQTVLGRQGEGPGEFESPRYLLEDDAGRIIVGDAATPRITTFDLAGETVPEIVRAPIAWLGGLHLMSDGSFVMSTSEMGPDADHVVAIMARGSDTVTTHFPIGATLPRGANDPAPWRSLTVFSATVLADTVFVTSSISDSLWVGSPTGEMAAYHLQIPGYEIPRDPESPPSSVAELQAWSSSFHTATRPLSGDGFLLLQFVKGVLNYGDPAIAVYRDRSGAWFALDDAPPIVAAGGREVLAIANPLEDPVRLAIYRARR